MGWSKPAIKDDKVAGIDVILAELLKNQSEDTHNLLSEIITKSYQTGGILKEFGKCRTIALPKKGTPMECSNYRTISTLLHASKILLGIIKEIIKNKMEPYVSEVQF